jgi:hypothetical protein
MVEMKSWWRKQLFAGRKLTQEVSSEHGDDITALGDMLHRLRKADPGFRV